MVHTCVFTPTACYSPVAEEAIKRGLFETTAVTNACSHPEKVVAIRSSQCFSGFEATGNDTQFGSQGLGPARSNP